MIDVTKASRETLESYANASEAIEDNPDHPGHLKRFTMVQQKLHRECATPKLRSRAEVDAELVSIVRGHHGRIDRDGLMRGISCIDGREETRIKALCAEPTAEEPAGKTLTLTTDIEALAKSLRETLNPSELVMLADLIDPTAGKEPAELGLGPAESRNAEAGKALCSTGYREEVRISAALLCLQMDIAAGKALYREHEGWSSRNPEPAELDLAEHEVCSCEEAEGLKARVAELEERIEKQRLAIDALNESRRKVLAAMWRT